MKLLKWYRKWSEKRNVWNTTDEGMFAYITKLQKCWEDWKKKRKVWSDADEEMFKHFLNKGTWYSVTRLVQVFTDRAAGDISTIPQENTQEYFVKGAIQNKNFALGRNQTGEWFVKQKRGGCRHGHK